MGRQADPRMAAAWERRLGRFGESGLTVARFCVSAHHRHPLAAGVEPEGAHQMSRPGRPTGVQRGAWPASPT